MYYDEMLETAVDAEIVSSDLPVNKKNTLAAVPKSIDHNYEKFNINFNKWKDGRFYKTITVELYGSGQCGSKIRNAVTGQRYPYLVGSADEDLFFKVSNVTGRYGRKNTLTLFYDSPQQYENQHFTSINEDVKTMWQEKNLAARHRLRIN
jgi:hypothetical protein